eukprot:6210236-Pleurochrysis_carterae.AAC.3
MRGDTNREPAICSAATGRAWQSKAVLSTATQPGRLNWALSAPNNTPATLLLPPVLLLPKAPPPPAPRAPPPPPAEALLPRLAAAAHAAPAAARVHAADREGGGV